VAEETINATHLLGLPVDLLQKLSSYGERVLRLDGLLDPNVRRAARGEASEPPRVTHHTKPA
jgi:hypothetical protein